MSVSIALALAFLAFFTPPIAMAVHAVRRCSWKWLLSSALLCYPITWYLDATPRFRGALLIMLAYPIGLWALWQGRPQLAWVPVGLITAFAAWVVLTIVLVPAS